MSGKSKSDKYQMVKLIYGYFMIIVSIFLLIFGIGSGLRILAYNFVFGEYPVVDERYICQEPIKLNPDEEPREEFVVNEECLERERKLRLIDDSITAFVQTSAGLIIILPHIRLVRDSKKDK